MEFIEGIGNEMILFGSMFLILSLIILKHLYSLINVSYSNYQQRREQQQQQQQQNTSRNDVPYEPTAPTMPEDMPVVDHEITMKFLDGSVMSFNILSTRTIGYIKNEILKEKFNQDERSRIRLIFGGRSFTDDSQLLATCNFPQVFTMHCVVCHNHNGPPNAQQQQQQQQQQQGGRVLRGAQLDTISNIFLKLFGAISLLLGWLSRVNFPIIFTNSSTFMMGLITFFFILTTTNVRHGRNIN
ncbi:hypothetical protein SNEBB_007238 [Seison nebaliae]|nr:hypothetical protein SNEBB_007238 [Seison nebaliae]